MPQQAEQVLGFLKDELARRQAKNPRYSLRAFARQSGVDPSALRQILCGQRRLSVKTAATILKHLDLTPTRRQKLLLSIADPETYTATAPSYRQLTQAEQGRLVDWRCYGVLCALELPKPPRTAKALAQFLGQGQAPIRRVLATLIDLGLIRPAEGGAGWIVTGDKLTTPPHAGTRHLKAAHREYIDVASRALDECYEASDFSGITMAVDPSRLPEAVRRIRDFRRELAQFLGEGQKQQVYRINIQLVPLSKDS